MGVVLVVIALVHVVHVSVMFVVVAFVVVVRSCHKVLLLYPKFSLLRAWSNDSSRLKYYKFIPFGVNNR